MQLLYLLQQWERQRSDIIIYSDEAIFPPPPPPPPQSRSFVFSHYFSSWMILEIRRTPTGWSKTTNIIMNRICNIDSKWSKLNQLIHLTLYSVMCSTVPSINMRIRPHLSSSVALSLFFAMLTLVISKCPLTDTRHRKAPRRRMLKSYDNKLWC